MLLSGLRNHIRNAAEWLPWVGQAATRHTPTIPNDLDVEDSGVTFVAGKDEMDYLWYRLCEREAGREYAGYRVVRLLQLRFLPLDVRSDPGLLQKMRTVLRGLYGSGVSFLYLTVGIFGEKPAGIVQCYGISAFGRTLEEAASKSQQSMAALKAALTGAYRQIRLQALTVQIAQWIFTAFCEMKHAVVTVGQPDPREGMRGGNNPAQRNPLVDGGMTGGQYTQQQNEILFRGMSDIQEDFLFLVLTSPILLGDITEMLTGLAEHTSTWAAWQQGSRGVSFGISLPAMLSGALMQSASQGYSNATGQAHTEGNAQSTGAANTTGKAHTEGVADSQGWSHSVGIAVSESEGQAQSSGQATTEGHAVTDGHAVTNGQAVMDGQSQSSSSGSNASENHGTNWGLSLNSGVLNYNKGFADGSGAGTFQAASNGTSHSETSSHAETASHAETDSQAQTASQSETASVGSSVTRSESWGSSGSHTKSSSDTTSAAETNSTSETASQADSQSQSQSIGQALGRGASSGLMVGIAPSLSVSSSYQWQFDPAILVTQILRQQQKLLADASKEGAYYTDVYALARSQQGKQALMSLIPEAFHGVEDVVTGVQTRSLTADESEYISRHAQAFTPSTRMETIPEVLSGYMDSTILTMLQLAAYTAPGAYEEGAALTVQEATPDFAFYPNLPGEVILGRQWSSEKGDLTTTLVRLSRERHFHTAFCGDTGFGKSVAAERLALETTLAWHYRTVVLDFGQGWRQALNWPGLEGRVDIRQLYPGALRPLRWNILQVPRRMLPSRYRSLISELFANAGSMGPRQLGFMRRALTELYGVGDENNSNKKPHETGYDVGLGVLTADSEVQNSPRWGHLVDRGEAAVINEWRDERGFVPPVQIGTPLNELQPGELQVLGVYRSQFANIRKWVSKLRRYAMELPKGDQASRASLEGVLLRMEQFSEGEMAGQYGPQQYGSGPGYDGSIPAPVEDLGLLGPESDPWGIVVIEGGAEMDEYPKAALLSLLASVLYFDAVVRRRERLGGITFPSMQIFFEEANKVLAGVSGGAAADQNAASSGHGAQVSEIFQSMWRDGRKYDIFLHPLVQTPSALPEGIFSSCNNGFFFQAKNPKDRDLILPHIGRSEKGIVNTEYKRFLARIPQKRCIAKLGYSDDVFDLEPMLIQPIRVPGSEPSDAEIVRRLGVV